MYKVKTNFQSSIAEKDLVISTLQKLGGEASVDEIFDLLDESISKEAIIDILHKQSRFTVKIGKWTPKHLISPIWEYIGPKPELVDLDCN